MTEVDWNRSLPYEALRIVCKRHGVQNKEQWQNVLQLVNRRTLSFLDLLEKLRLLKWCYK